MQVSFSIFLTNSGTGTTSTTTFPKASSCTCTSGGCNLNGYSYIASLPILAGVVATKTYATSCQSGTVPYSYTISSGTSCSPLACSLLSDGTYQTITCSGSGSGSSSGTSSGSSSSSGVTSSSGSSVGRITTGYGQYAAFAASDTSCSTVLLAIVYPLGVCLLTGSSQSAYFYADSNGYIYSITYTNNACR